MFEPPLGRLSLAIDLCGDKVGAAKRFRRGDLIDQRQSRLQISPPHGVVADERGSTRSPQHAGEVLAGFTRYEAVRWNLRLRL